MQLPPPVHGASVVNLNIHNSEYINSKFISKYRDISPAKELSDLGSLGVKKILLTLKIVLLSLYDYIVFKPSLVYLTLSPHGVAFYKDALILLLLKVFGADIVVHLHGKGISSEVSKSSFKLRIYRIVFKGVSIIHLSENLFSDVAMVRDENKLLIAINNGVKDEGEVNFGESQKLNILYLSSLEKTKGIDTLISAVNALDEGI
ncbi:MAG: hypothetical protein RPR97_06910, partial [Colwellia sp.]